MIGDELLSLGAGGASRVVPNVSQVVWLVGALDQKIFSILKYTLPTWKLKMMGF